MQKNVWLIGAGNMAKEHARVLMAQGVAFEVIGKGEESAKNFEQLVGHTVVTGGLPRFLERNPPLPDAAIVTVDMEAMHDCAATLLSVGVPRLLLEIPGGVDSAEIRDIAQRGDEAGALVLVAYNRRFYASVQELRRRMAEDGGAKSLFFEFTEWRHVVEKLRKPSVVKSHWGYANSVHVMDTAFFLCGAPKDLSCYHAGILPWHTPAIFCGSGVTQSHIPFAYHSNWDGPGRWGIEICTSKHRYYLRPFEILRMQDMGSLKINEVPIDNIYDVNFKPGLYKEIEALLSDTVKDNNDVLRVDIHAQMCTFYDMILSYNSTFSNS